MNDFSVRAFLREKKINVNNMLCVCIIGAIVIVMLVGTSYALPAADDFTHANSMHDTLQNSHNVLSAIFTRVKSVYMHEQGTFMSGILAAVLSSPEIVKVLLQINVLLFLFSVIWAGAKMIKNMYGQYDRNALLLLVTLFLFISIGMCRGGQQIFYWRTGALVYTMPMSLTFCCFAFYIEYLWEKKNSRRRLLLLCILSFLTSGGILQVTGIFCYGMLSMWLLYWKNHRGKNRVLAGVPFLAALAGALVNAAAPGNFARHKSYEEGIHIFKAVKNTLKIVFNQSAEVLRGENLILYVIFFCIVFGAAMTARAERKSRNFHPFLLGLAVLAGWAVSIFPFCLGYGASTMVQLRNFYICDLYLGWGSAICALEFGSWLETKGGYKFSKKSVLISALCMGLVFFRSGDVVKIFHNGTVGETIAEMFSGDLQRASSGWREVLREISNSEDEEADIEVVGGIPETILMPPSLREDKEWFGNVVIARYYEKKSVAVTFMEEE